MYDTTQITRNPRWNRTADVSKQNTGRCYNQLLGLVQNVGSHDIKLYLLSASEVGGGSLFISPISEQPWFKFANPWDLTPSRLYM